MFYQRFNFLFALFLIFFAFNLLENLSNGSAAVVKLCRAQSDWWTVQMNFSIWFFINKIIFSIITYKFSVLRDKPRILYFKNSIKQMIPAASDQKVPRTPKIRLNISDLIHRGPVCEDYQKFAGVSLVWIWKPPFFSKYVNKGKRRQPSPQLLCSKTRF